jgi:hypothetical protein
MRLGLLTSCPRWRFGLVFAVVSARILDSRNT